MATVPPEAPNDGALQLVCLCAGWCTACAAYQPQWAIWAARHPDVAFIWLDVEDHADALDAAVPGGVDIENFPTLLLSRAGQPLFFGTVLPHASVVEGLLRQGASLPQLKDAAATQLCAAVDGLLGRGALQRSGA